MPSLGRKEKVFLVERLALFDSPSEVAAAYEEEFGREIDRRQVWQYDASKPYPRGRMAADLVGLFDTVRSAFLADAGAVPIANKNVRLRELQKLLDRLKPHPSQTMAVAELLRQAAQEAGGAFTNRRELSGPGGGPIRTETTYDLSDLADDELDALERAAERAVARTDPGREGD